MFLVSTIRNSACTTNVRSRHFYNSPSSFLDAFGLLFVVFASIEVLPLYLWGAFSFLGSTKFVDVGGFTEIVISMKDLNFTFIPRTH